jgi:hypothetical protein
MDTDEVASVEKFEKAKRDLERLLAEIKRLEALIAELEAGMDASMEDLVKARLELARLEDERHRLMTVKPEEPEMEIPVVDTEKHLQRMEAMQQELKELAEKIKELKTELKERGKPPEPARVVIQPGGTGYDLEPTFVECDAGSIVIHEGEKPQRVRAGDMETDETFLALLDRVARQPKGTVIFLVRDDGLGVYYRAHRFAQSRFARNGKLPVIGDGEIDLSIFEK